MGEWRQRLIVTHKERVVTCRAFLPRNSACSCVCVCSYIYIYTCVCSCALCTHMNGMLCGSQMTMPDVFFNCFSLVVETGSLTEPRVHLFD